MVSVEAEWTAEDQAGKLSQFVAWFALFCDIFP
jgi:hypothetical protein